MTRPELQQLSDAELLVLKKKMKEAKLFYAVFIGFLVGVLLFGVVAWALSPQKQFGFLIPMFIPILLIKKLRQPSPQHQELEAVLQERGL